MNARDWTRFGGSGPISVFERGSRSDEVSVGVLGSTHEYGDDLECRFSMRTVSLRAE